MIKHNKCNIPVAILTEEQTKGKGSRTNDWSGGKGNFFASIAISIDMLTKDLPLNAASIYFAYIMKKSLASFEEEVWIKWPNDLYKNNNKVGGIITNTKDNILVVGIGINLKKDRNGFSSLNNDIEPIQLLNKFLLDLRESITWKQVFSEFQLEFEKSKAFFTHDGSVKVDMKNAVLCNDGSLVIQNRKVYNLR